jgi:NarL family two-component system sensor histidine kinase LiaS
MARDLHDSVKQQIFALSMNLAAAQALWNTNPVESHKQLDRGIVLAGQAQNELMSLIQAQLDPPEPVSLVERIESLAESWEESSGIPLKIAIENMDPVSGSTAETLYRITQEALANVARHSQARSVALELKTENGCGVLSIRDDGKGFNPLPDHWGVGLRSMRERAQSLQGDLSIRSDRNGTMLEIRIPIDADSKVIKTEDWS